MDKNFLFDDILKEKASNEKTVLPQDLDIKIKETINNLPERKKWKNRFIRKAAVAAGITIVFATCLSAAFPAYARNVPVVSSVFQFLSDKNIIDRDYIPYSSDLNLSRTSNGVTVTLNSIVYDGIELSIGYTVQSKDELKSDPFTLDREIRINGKLVSFGSGGTGELINKNTYVGVESFEVARGYLPTEIKRNILGGNVRIPNTFIMDYNIKELSDNLTYDIKGNWDFKFKVSKDKIKGKVKEINTSVDLSALRPGLRVNEVILTPITTVLRTVDDNKVLDENVDYFVFDDKGRALSCSGVSSDVSEKSNKRYYQYTFKNIYEDTKSITFIPAVYTEEYEKKMAQNNKNNNSCWKDDRKEVPLNINTTTVLSEGNLGEYKITQIEFLRDKTLVHYECTGLISAINPYLLTITDGTGKNYVLLKEAVKNLGDDKFIAEIEPLSKDKQYKLSAVDYDKIYDVRENLKFTIKVK